LSQFRLGAGYCGQRNHIPSGRSGWRKNVAAFRRQRCGRPVEQAIAAVLAEAKVRTPDIGGNSSTQELGEAIARQVSAA
jgi:hypothetical protein